MPYDARKHRRRSIRLPHYDYASPGAYFVTLCVHGGRCLLGEVVDDEMQRSAWGEIAHEEWQASADIRKELELDAFVVMPNHVHGIIWITADHGADCRAPRRLDDSPDGRAHGRAPLPQDNPANCRAFLHRLPRSLGAFVAGYKSVVTKRVNQLRHMPGTPLWQRNYWEHVIRSEQTLNRIREYINNNPARWADDQLHPDAPANAFNQWST